MLPENEFHAAPFKPTPKPNNSKWYSTEDVIGLTKMSRYTLARKTRNESFPRPIKVNQSNKYSKKEVDAWIKENKEEFQKHNPNKNITLILTPKQYRHMQSSSKMLECKIETFILEAAVHKSNQVQKMSKNKYFENNFMI